MEWIRSISGAVEFIEQHITENITVDDVAGSVNISSFYFQKGFSILCGLTVMEYIRNRRLALAGNDLAVSGTKVIDAAVKYGYESPDSFTKAFVRFHGITPSAAGREGAVLKSFAPLRLKISLEGGYLMDYQIVKKAEFRVMGTARNFNYETAKQEIPGFWQNHYASGKGSKVAGMFGISIDKQMGNNEFEYLIADVYNPVNEVTEEFVVRTIPEFDWAVFKCHGAMPDAVQKLNSRIFSEWLPALTEYELAAGYCVEMYDAPDKYPNGTKDKDYYTEIWIPVKKK